MGENGEINYKPLKTEFRKFGFDYKQIKREGDVILFSQSKMGTITSYEVGVIDRCEAFERWGRMNEATEMYPASCNWGKLGFTCGSLERAEEKFRNMVEFYKNKKKEDSSENKSE